MRLRRRRVRRGGCWPARTAGPLGWPGPLHPIALVVFPPGSRKVRVEVGMRVLHASPAPLLPEQCRMHAKPCNLPAECGDGPTTRAPPGSAGAGWENTTVSAIRRVTCPRLSGADAGPRRPKRPRVRDIPAVTLPWLPAPAVTHGDGARVERATKEGPVVSLAPRGDEQVGRAQTSQAWRRRGRPPPPSLAPPDFYPEADQLPDGEDEAAGAMPPAMAKPPPAQPPRSGRRGAVCGVTGTRRGLGASVAERMERRVRAWMRSRCSWPGLLWLCRWSLVVVLVMESCTAGTPTGNCPFHGSPRNRRGPYVLARFPIGSLPLERPGSSSTTASPEGPTPPARRRAAPGHRGAACRRTWRGSRILRRRFSPTPSGVVVGRGTRRDGGVCKRPRQCH